jgi:hypothetical protein
MVSSSATENIANENYGKEIKQGLVQLTGHIFEDVIDLTVFLFMFMQTLQLKMYLYFGAIAAVRLLAAVLMFALERRNLMPKDRKRLLLQKGLGIGFWACLALCALFGIPYTLAASVLHVNLGVTLSGSCCNEEVR